MTASERATLVDRVRTARAEQCKTLECSYCHAEKPDDAFPRRATISPTGKRRGRAYECLACLSERRRKPRRSVRGEELAAIRRLLEAIAEPQPKAMQCVCAECEELRAREFAKQGLEILRGGAPRSSTSAPTGHTGSDS